MSFLHRTRFWAVLPSSVQLSPMPFTSQSKSLLQLFLGRPPFLFPWGFHERACRVVLLAGFRRVWPIQPHFLLLTCSAIRSSSARSHSCSLVTISFQQKPRILLRQLLTKLCTLLCILFVVLQVSDPLSRTVFTFDLNMRSLVLTDSSFDAHTFFNMINTALAFPILVSASLSVPTTKKII